MRQINLLPEELQQAEKFNFIRNACVIILLPGLMVLLFIHFILAARLKQLEIVAQQPLALQETTEARDLQQKKDELQTQARDFYDKHKNIIEKFVKKFSVAHLLRAVSRIASGKVWLKSIVLDASKDSCRIEGKSFNTRLVSEFMLELKRLPYFDNVELVNMNKDAARDIKEIDFQVIGYLK